MKIEQESSFKPVTITMETAAEVEAVWKAVSAGSVNALLSDSRAVLAKIDNWFCNLANTGEDISKEN